MGVMAELDPFSFEAEIELTEADYVELNSFLPRKTRWLRRSALIALGVVLLLSQYTMALGIALLLLLLLVVVSPSIVTGTAERQFKEGPNLRGPIVYGISDEKLWLKSPLVEQSSSWENLAVWE